MDPFSGAAAIISLTLQLAGTAHGIRKFLSGIRNAPNEIADVLELLGCLEGNLKSVQILLDLQSSITGTPQISVCVIQSLRTCEKKIILLELFVNKLNKTSCHRYLTRKAWTSMRMVSRMQDLNSIRYQLRDAVAALQLALSINSTYIQ